MLEVIIKEQFVGNIRSFWKTNPKIIIYHEGEARVVSREVNSLKIIYGFDIKKLLHTLFCGKALFKVCCFFKFLIVLCTNEQSSLLLILILYALRLYSFPQLNIWVAANKVSFFYFYTELSFLEEDSSLVGDFVLKKELKLKQGTIIKATKLVV